MPQHPQNRALDDDELLSVFHSKEDLSLLTPAEQQRLVVLTEPKAAAKPEAEPQTSAADYLPMIGGAIGGLAGGSKASPIGMAAAAAGGAAGEGYKQLAQHAGEIPGAAWDVAKNLFSEPMATLRGAAQGIGEGAANAATEGGKQALYEGGGRALSAVARPVAKTIYGLALRPSPALARNYGGGSVVKGLSRLTGQGLDDAVLPSSLGAGRAQKLLDQSRGVASDIASKSKMRVGTGRLVQDIETEQLGKMAEHARGGVKPNTAGLTDVTARMRAENPAQLSMGDLHKLKGIAQDIADPAFAAAKQPGGVRPAYGSVESINKTGATKMRAVLNALLGKDYEAANTLAQSRGGVQKAVGAAAGRGSLMENVVSGLGGGAAMMSGHPAHALTAYALLRALSSPTAQGAAAIGLAKMPYAQLLRAGDATGVNDLSTDLPYLLKQMQQ